MLGMDAEVGESVETAAARGNSAKEVAENSDRGGSSLATAELDETAVRSTDSDDESVDESESVSGDVDSVTHMDGDVNPDLKKKKKKRKKKKKAGKDAGEQEHFAELEAQMLPHEIADKRYSSSLESIRNDNALLWIQLNRCRITDKRARKLFSALKDNTTLTSLDLSENLLTDETVQSLMRVLATGSAPNLIYVDVRSNPISSKSQDLLRRLQSLRKHLKVDFQVYPFGQDLVEGTTIGNAEWMEGFPRGNWMANFTDNGASSSWGETSTPYNHPRLSNPEALQEKVEFALIIIKKSSANLRVSSLASSLREIIINFSQRLYADHGKTDWKTVEQLPKGLPLLLGKLGVFLSILDMSPQPVQCQRKLEEQAAGLHRIALVELLNLLLMPASPCIEDKFLAEGAPARLISLFVQFPWNSILQGATFRSLQAMLSKPTLHSAVLLGSSGLISILPKAGEECAALPMGKRPGYGGYVVRLSKEVEFLAEKDKDIRNLLMDNEQWMKYVGPDGPLKRMVTEQTGHLGGPKPIFTRSVTQFFPNEYGGMTSTLKQLRGLFLP